MKGGEEGGFVVMRGGLGGWYPCSTPLAFFTSRGSSFHPALIRRTPSVVSRRLTTPGTTCAAWRRAARRNGPERPANVAHGGKTGCGGR